jgi:hypothetical protein
MSDEIEIEQIDGDGKPVTVSRAYWDRWPSLHEVFRPVAEKKTANAVVKETTPVVVEPPTGDEEKEK